MTSFSHRSRAGMTLIEVMVVIAIVVAVSAVGIGALTSSSTLNQRKAARDLALTYELLHDEAVLRNLTFRVVYHLDGGFYKIESGDPTTLIFTDPESRRDYERNRDAKLRGRTKKERAAIMAEEQEDFMAVGKLFKQQIELPRGSVFGGVYTPQYGELVTPSGEDDPEKQRIAYSYIFASGFTEHTIVQIVDIDDDQSGYTVEVEPLSGTVHLDPEIHGPDKRFDFVPTEGPGLSE